MSEQRKEPFFVYNCARIMILRVRMNLKNTYKIESGLFRYKQSCEVRSLWGSEIGKYVRTFLAEIKMVVNVCETQVI